MTEICGRVLRDSPEGTLHFECTLPFAHGGDAHHFTPDLEALAEAAGEWLSEYGPYDEPLARKVRAALHLIWHAEETTGTPNG